MGRQLREARELGNYELIEQLGEGGMGSVWRARHRMLARDAAVKLVRPEVMGDTESAAQAQLRRFEREAQATALRADVYAIGCVAFYLLTGTRVFQDGTQMQALIDHVHATPVAPSARLRGNLPREVDDLVLSCLRKHPADRPHDAGELLATIRQCQLSRGWSNDHARAWWTARLPELAGPLA